MEYHSSENPNGMGVRLRERAAFCSHPNRRPTAAILAHHYVASPTMQDGKEPVCQSTCVVRSPPSEMPVCFAPPHASPQTATQKGRERETLDTIAVTIPFHSIPSPSAFLSSSPFPTSSIIQSNNCCMCGVGLVWQGSSAIKPLCRYG